MSSSSISKSFQFTLDTFDDESPADSKTTGSSTKTTILFQSLAQRSSNQSYYDKGLIIPLLDAPCRSRRRISGIPNLLWSEIRPRTNTSRSRPSDTRDAGSRGSSSHYI